MDKKDGKQFFEYFSESKDKILMFQHSLYYFFHLYVKELELDNGIFN